MRCLLLLGALRAATALAPEAVEALLSIGDGERLSYLDFREALHNEWSGNVSGPAVAAVLTACGGSYCRPDPPVGRRDLAGSNRPIGRRPTDRLVADAKARAAVERFWRPRAEARPLIARRVLGGAHPLVLDIDRALEASRAGLRARETPSGSAY